MRRRLAVVTVVAAIVGLLPVAAVAEDEPTPGEVSATPPPDVDSLEGLSAPVTSIITTVESLGGDEAAKDDGTTRTVILSSRVLFAENSANLSAAARTRLQSVAEQIKAAKASGVVQVNGYTDDQGSAAYGLELSRKRANAVRSVLQPLLSGAGVTLTTKGFGEANPRFPNLDDSGDPIEKNRARNRRVEIAYKPA